MRKILDHTPHTYTNHRMENFFPHIPTLVLTSTCFSS